MAYTMCTDSHPLLSFWYVEYMHEKLEPEMQYTQLDRETYRSLHPHDCTVGLMGYGYYFASAHSHCIWSISMIPISYIL